MNDEKMNEMVNNLLIHLPLFYQGVTRQDLNSKQRLTAHYQILGVLEHYEGLKMSELGEKLFISRPNMTVHVDKLVKEGLVKRMPDEKDRRIIKVAITPKGRDFIVESRSMVKKYIKKNLSALSSSELEDIYKSTETIRKALLVIRKDRNGN